MEVIRDHKQLKNAINQNYDYVCLGFTKSNLFNLTHDHLYNHAALYLTSEKNKLFGTVWDNIYDAQIFQGKEATPAEVDEQMIIDWFSSRGFEYLFLPPVNFVNQIMSLPNYSQIKAEIDQIWINENYDRFLTDWLREDNTNWLKLLLLRHYLIFSTRFEKLINRTCQPLAPDGTWGYIFKHFLTKYCGGNYPMVPVIRNEDGTPFDIIIERYYPQEVKDVFSKLTVPFNQFRESRDLNTLITECTEIINKFEKFRPLQFQLVDFKYFKDPEITFDKYLFKIQIRSNRLRDNNQYDMFRYWEYDSGI